MPVAATRYRKGLDPHLEATVIEPFIEWMVATQRKERSWARQCASPLRQLLREWDEETLVTIDPDQLHLWSDYSTRTPATGKASRHVLRLFREYRGVR